MLPCGRGVLGKINTGAEKLIEALLRLSVHIVYSKNYKNYQRGEIYSMIRVIFEWDGDRFGASFKTRKEVDDAWRWLVRRYPGARIVDIRIFPNEVLTINHV